MIPLQASRTRILVADDQPDIREALRLLLKGEGFETEIVSSPTAVLSALDAREFDALLMDLNYARDTTSGQEGLDLLSNIRSRESTLPIIVMTAWGSLELAVEAMRRGAKDFIQKPWENARLLAILKTQIELVAGFEEEPAPGSGKPLAARRRAPHAHRRIGLDAARAGSDRARGPVGCQRADHRRARHRQGGRRAHVVRACLPRAGRPLVTVNAGGLPEGVFESELFGHVKGAFTDAKSDRVGRFELADGGTLFLDEIANVPLNLQAKLLRALETRRVRARGLFDNAARGRRVFFPRRTPMCRPKRPPGASARTCSSGSNTIEIHLPPLRERHEDIPAARASFPAAIGATLPQAG